jgi:hypothetical protein
LGRKVMTALWEQPSGMCSSATVGTIRLQAVPGTIGFRIRVRQVRALARSQVAVISDPLSMLRVS